LSGDARGHLAANVMHFARVLRAAGMPVGTDRVTVALQALPLAGLASRADCRAVLAACLLDRAEHRALFDQAFDLFWREPALPGALTVAAQPPAPAGADTAAGGRRLASALFPHATPAAADAATPPRSSWRASAPSWAEAERLRHVDFETMTADEWRAAKGLLARLKPAFEPLPTRRTRPSARPGQPDWRAALAAMARQGGDGADLRWRRRRAQPPPLVLLADISGSMSRYARMLLHFGHALAQSDLRVESFVFGTRLTRISRLLRHRDPDAAVALAVAAAPDWAGGTRLAECLHAFNRHWARRVMPGNATLLLVTDGLAHGDGTALAAEMARLHRGCRQLIWLNPLLRFEGFEPRATGIRAMLPHVDRFLPAHDLHSLDGLARALARPPDHRSRQMRGVCHSPI
jgi:uncharacterized protein with von Willebrand factor type A (vWA) domain